MSELTPEDLTFLKQYIPEFTFSAQNWIIDVLEISSSVCCQKLLSSTYMFVPSIAFPLMYTDWFATLAS